MVKPHVNKYKQMATTQILASISANLSIADKNAKFKEVEKVGQKPENKIEAETLEFLETTFDPRMDKWEPGYAECVTAVNLPPTNSEILVSITIN